MKRWTATLVAAVLAGAVWLVTALDGHGPETIWLPAVAIAAAWPREGRPTSCRRRRLPRAPHA